ncbi:unnamed protein product, partial [marine sediment metagenome]
SVFCQQILRAAESELQCVVSGGVADSQPGESSEKMLGRADSALYSARASAGARLYQHNGQAIRPFAAEMVVASDEPSRKGRESSDGVLSQSEQAAESLAAL